LESNELFSISRENISDMLFRDAIERKRSRNDFEPTGLGIDEEWCRLWTKLEQYRFPLEPQPP
jgi:hypothetical protein